MNSGDKPSVAAPNNPLISDMEGNRYDTICKGAERDHTVEAQPFISVNI